MSSVVRRVINKPFRVTFSAIGEHAYTGQGWVHAQDCIKTVSGETVTVYTVKMDNPPEEGDYILLGDGEILERAEPVDWVTSEDA